MYKKIDLHLHTSISDGSDSLEELLDNVRAAGISLFSVSDHDAILGGLRMPELLTHGDPDFIRGVEFSCKDELGKYHVLGYGYDPDAPAIQEVVEQGHALRMEKLTGRLNYLNEEFGFQFPQEELDMLYAKENPGKPHIALMMIKHGYAESIQEAIEKYIDKKRFRNKHVRPEVAIEGILKSGGIPVLAHPCYGSGDELILKDEMEERLRRLMGFGLMGLEGYYSGFPQKLSQEMIGLAEKYGLYVTAGSDYHGANKMVPLGDNDLEDAAQGPEGLHRFLQDVEIISK